MIDTSNVCILFALNRESMYFRHKVPPLQRFRGAPCQAWLCGCPHLAALMMETGMGSRAATRAINWVLSRPSLGTNRFHAKLVISAGFAGALDPSLAVGDVLSATELADEDGHIWHATPPTTGPAMSHFHQGRIVSISRLAASKTEKKELYHKHQALAVDMESASIARACAEAKVPFACVRAISDSTDSSLSPQMAELISGGRVSPMKLVLAVVRSPRLIGEMRRLAKDTCLAAKQLGRALEQILISDYKSKEL